jgi:protein-S-isoprenylcysteine O-methyltransferase Ste14
LPLLLDDPAASRLLAGAVGAFVVGEAVSTYLGQARDGQRRPLGSLAESLLLTRRRDAAAPQDRSTKWIVVLASRAGVGAAFAIAVLVPRFRAYANDWWTFAVGIALVLTGVALRAWAIFTLGRYFRREVTIEPGQRLVRSGPYRVLRHPSYAGILLAVAGLGLAFGSWVSAVAALVIVFVGLLPRIRVEERALAQAFGAEYADYESSTARLLPYVW